MSFNRRCSRTAFAVAIFFCTLLSIVAVVLDSPVGIDQQRDVASASYALGALPDAASLASLSQAVQADSESANTKWDITWCVKGRAFTSRLGHQPRHVVADSNFVTKTQTLLNLGTSLRL
mgnify:CR=1 FL=1